VSSEDYIKFLTTRRSIRKYKKEPVALDQLIKVIDTARFAPSAKNSQPWEFVIVVDPKTKHDLASVYPWRQALRDAPAGIVVLCDETASPMFYMLDCANAVTYLMLAAHAVGLGTVWLGVGEKEKPIIQEIVGAPKHKVPIAIVAIGYPDESPKPRPRKPVDDIVHINRYGNRLTVSS